MIIEKNPASPKFRKTEYLTENESRIAIFFQIPAKVFDV